MFALTQIPQVVMNIDYKLEPTADREYYDDRDFHSYAKLLYPFKNINFTPDLCILGFIERVVQESKYLCLFVKTDSCGRYMSVICPLYGRKQTRVNMNNEAFDNSVLLHQQVIHTFYLVQT